MTINETDPDELAEPEIAEFATELSAAAEDALQTMTSRREYVGGGAEGQSVDHHLNLQTILRIPVTMKVVVGSVVLPVSELKKLKKGDTIPLDRRVGEPVDIVVNGQVLARGLLVIVDGDEARLGVSLKEIVELPSAKSEGRLPRRS
jgi:flagellar motor switch protein FliN/FliY